MIKKTLIAAAALGVVALGGAALAGDDAAADKSPSIPTVYVAVTGPDGSLVGGVGVKSVKYPADIQGSYKVTFKKNVDTCAIQATSSRFQYPVEAAPFTGDKKSVYVFMHNSQGVGGVGGFYLTLLCP